MSERRGSVTTFVSRHDAPSEPVYPPEIWRAFRFHVGHVFGSMVSRVIPAENDTPMPRLTESFGVSRGVWTTGLGAPDTACTLPRGHAALLRARNIFIWPGTTSLAVFCCQLRISRHPVRVMGHELRGRLALRTVFRLNDRVYARRTPYLGFLSMKVSSWVRCMRPLPLFWRNRLVCTYMRVIIPPKPHTRSYGVVL